LSRIVTDGTAITAISVPERAPSILSVTESWSGNGTPGNNRSLDLSAESRWATSEFLDQRVASCPWRVRSIPRVVAQAPVPMIPTRVTSAVYGVLCALRGAARFSRRDSLPFASRSMFDRWLQIIKIGTGIANSKYQIS